MNDLAKGTRVKSRDGKAFGVITEITMITDRREYTLHSAGVMEALRNNELFFHIEWDKKVYPSGLYSYGSDFVKLDG